MNDTTHTPHRVEREGVGDPATPDRGWWGFEQNNSGGWLDKECGHATWINAASAAEACAIAERHGIYFDGCYRGSDCSCCGDRWSRPWGSEPDEPDVPIRTLVEKLTRREKGVWGKPRPSAADYAFGWGLGIRIIDHDGSVTWIRPPE